MKISDFLTEKPILATKRLILRTMTIEDVPDLKEWMPNKELYKYWGKKPGKTDKNPELLFISKAKPTKSFHWGIVHKNDNKVIGEAWVYLIENNRMAKVAIRLSDKYHGKGLGTETLERIIRFCFEETELQRLWTDVDIRNIASVRMVEQCGFIREGTIRQGKMVSTWCDYHLYGLLKEDYEKAHE